MEPGDPWKVADPHTIHSHVPSTQDSSGGLNPYRYKPAEWRHLGAATHYWLGWVEDRSQPGCLALRLVQGDVSLFEQLSNICSIRQV